MRAEQIMTRNVFTCSAVDTLEQAAQEMWEADVGCLVVTDALIRPIGVITDRDIAMAAYIKGALLRDVHVGDVMSKRVLTCTSSTPISEVEALMRAGQIRRVPVVGAGDKLVGLVTLGDLVRDVGSGARRLPAMPALTKTLAAITERRPPTS